MQTKTVETEPEFRLQGPSWLNISFLAAVHAIGIGGTIALGISRGISTFAMVFTFIWTALTILAISAGYHRLFSHRAYDAHPVVRFLLLAFGAASFQNSALKWSRDHRRHHARVDTDLDPYNVRQGFWHSHIGWVLRQENPNIVPMPVRDLERDALVMWQHRHYALIATVVGLVVPTLFGFAFGDAWGGFLLGGVLRLVFTYHTTFSINSFAHIVGTQPYSDRDSSRDSFIIALVSMGEGYHNFHHTFPADYRNGGLAHQFDPSKWMIRSLALVGATSNLRVTPRPVILRAQLRMEAQRLEARPLSPASRDRALRLRAALHERLDRWNALVARCEVAKKEAGVQARIVLTEKRAEIRQVRREIREAFATWRELQRAPELA